MATGYQVLSLVALALLVFRLGLALKRRGSEEEKNYPDPDLKLDDEPEQPQDVFGELQSTLSVDQEADRRYFDAAENDVASGRWPVSRKVVMTGLTAWAIVLVPYAHPAMAPLRILREVEGEPEGAPESAGHVLPPEAMGETKLPGATTDDQARAKELTEQVDSRGPIAHSKAPKLQAVKEDEPPLDIKDAQGSLHRFFDKLMRVEAKQEGAVARILYYGDSIIASDFVTGKLRRRLQSRFGDAGHGYAILANAWPGWFHLDVMRQASGEWRASTCVGPYAKDGLYGTGCASFQSYFPKIWAEIGTATRDEWGRKVGSFEIEYLKQPKGGAFKVMVDGKLKTTLDTASESMELAYHRVDVPDGPHKLRLETTSKKRTRIFGVRMERDVPGIQLSACGITGARARFLDKQDDAHWAAVLKKARPDLVVLSYGTNECADGKKYPLEKYRETLEAVMLQVERALPNASYMLNAPPDFASKKATWGHSRPSITTIVAEVEGMARKRGWAFWNQFKAMGGTGSMWSWIPAGLGSTDMFHPTGRGGNLLGNWLYLALMKDYEAYKATKQ